VDAECVFCVLPALFTYYLDKASKKSDNFPADQLADFQELQCQLLPHS
jgi:hypothetical protein